MPKTFTASKVSWIGIIFCGRPCGRWCMPNKVTWIGIIVLWNRNEDMPLYHIFKLIILLILACFCWVLTQTTSLVENTRLNATWIEPMVVINSQPWGIVYWLVFKSLPVQTTYLFLQAFLKFFYSQEMLTTSEITFKLHLILTLSVELQTIMTFYEENYGQNELNL